jgi:hypothetical protein
MFCCPSHTYQQTQRALCDCWMRCFGVWDYVRACVWDYVGTCVWDSVEFACFVVPAARTNKRNGHFGPDSFPPLSHLALARFHLFHIWPWLVSLFFTSGPGSFPSFSHMALARFPLFHIWPWHVFFFFTSGPGSFPSFSTSGPGSFPSFSHLALARFFIFHIWPWLVSLFFHIWP